MSRIDVTDGRGQEGTATDWQILKEIESEAGEFELEGKLVIRSTHSIFGPNTITEMGTAPEVLKMKRNFELIACTVCNLMKQSAAWTYLYRYNMYVYINNFCQWWHYFGTKTANVKVTAKISRIVSLWMLLHSSAFVAYYEFNDRKKARTRRESEIKREREWKSRTSARKSSSKWMIEKQSKRWSKRFASTISALNLR